MLSLEQMVSAKLFMRNYKDAFQCIDDSAKKENSLESYGKFYALTQTAKESDQIIYSDGQVEAGKNFNSSVFKTYAKYAADLRSKYFPSGYQSFDQMNEALDKGIADLNG